MDFEPGIDDGLGSRVGADPGGPRKDVHRSFAAVRVPAVLVVLLVLVVSTLVVKWYQRHQHYE